jgi:hypothetical protein
MKRNYAGSFQVQGRSIGIEKDEVDLDLVVTAAPSVAQEELLKSQSISSASAIGGLSDWRLNPYWLPEDQRNTAANLEILAKALREEDWTVEPLQIPDRDVEIWEDTDPVAQIKWTWDKNARTNKHYVNVVKAIKWWRRSKFPEHDYPKGYPVEHIVGDCCPDRISSVAEGVTRTFETIVSNYSLHASSGTVPNLPDRGVPTHNVLKRLSPGDFKWFYDRCAEGAAVSRRAINDTTVASSAAAWRELFGPEFPPAPDSDGNDSGPGGGYTPRTGVSRISGGRFAS